MSDTTAIADMPLNYNLLDKIRPEDLTIGMYVCELDRPWLDTPFLFQGFVIESIADIDALARMCDFVYIDKTKAQFSNEYARHNLIKSKQKAIKRPETLLSEDEVPVAHGTYNETLKSVEQMLRNVRSNTAFDSSQIRKQIKKCTQSIIRNPSAMLWLSRIKHVDNYTAEHCLNVAILAISLGRHMGLSNADLEMLGMCGILHDVGKMQIDPDILNKPARLSNEEFETMKLHTVHGKFILTQDEKLATFIVEAAYSHHERMDGKGYPRGLYADKLSMFTRAVSIVDAFDAMTSNRCYSDARTTSDALKILYNNRNGQFDEELTIKFIECIGLYPPGCLVELNSGEVGFIISNNPTSRLLPRVALLLDENKNPIMQHIVNLQAQYGPEKASKNYIRKMLSDGSFGLWLSDFTRNNVHIDPKNHH